MQVTRKATYSIASNASNHTAHPSSSRPSLSRLPAINEDQAAPILPQPAPSLKALKRSPPSTDLQQLLKSSK